MYKGQERIYSDIEFEMFKDSILLDKSIFKLHNP